MAPTTAKVDQGDDREGDDEGARNDPAGIDDVSPEFDDAVGPEVREREQRDAEGKVAAPPLEESVQVTWVELPESLPREEQQRRDHHDDHRALHLRSNANAEHVDHVEHRDDGHGGGAHGQVRPEDAQITCARHAVERDLPEEGGQHVHPQADEGQAGRHHATWIPVVAAVRRNGRPEHGQRQHAQEDRDHGEAVRERERGADDLEHDAGEHEDAAADREADRNERHLGQAEDAS
jgi:hypothetical protein